MAYNLTLNNQQMQLSLARTGGQGTKGDSVSSVTMDGNGDLIVVITDAAGNQVSSTNVGGSAYITATENLYDQFDDRYLGDKSSAPSVDNDGNTLLTGAIYFDTTSNTFAFWNGSIWKYPVTEATTQVALAQAAKTAAETAETNAETAKTNAETAETNAAASATTASTQATNAATSAAASLTSANNAAASETASAASATSAATSATNAATSATTAATHENNTATSATAAATSATNAANSATTANTAATNAATSETNAAASATTATAQATIATNAQNAASASASAAATSETNAAASQSSAGSSATAASNSATAAANSASNASATLASVETLYDNFDDRFLGNKSSDPATDNDGNALAVGTFYYNTTTNELKVYTGSAWVAPSTSASNSASSAATSATSAANSATAAGSSATAAATSATNASTSATAAGTSATSASNSATAAQTAQTAAETALDSFDDRYLGAKSSDPTVDNDGDALLTGALYFNSTNSSLKVYNGTSWDITTSTTESIQDTVNSLLVSGNGIDLDYNDSANTLTITNTDITNTANVTAAGALMDSEVTNLAQVKAFDSSDYATAAQGTTADAALPKAGGTMTGNLILNANPSVNLGAATKQYVDSSVSNLVDSAPSTLDTLNELAAALGDDANFSTTITNSIASKLSLSGGQMTGNITMSGSQTVDGRDLSVDGAKLDGIASGATAYSNSSVDTHLNTGTASNGQYLGWNGSDYDWATVSTDLVADTSPQLGGDLDANNNAIRLGDNSDYFGNGSEGNMIIMGADEDFRIFKGATNNYIRSENGGNLLIQGHSQVTLTSNTGENMAQFTKDGSARLFHDGSKKLETTTTGVEITGTVNVNGVYTLPTSDGTANQVLTTDGSGAVTFADAGGGGADLFAENYDSTSTLPSATGTNSIAIGVDAISTGNRSVVIGKGNAAGQDSFVAAGSTNTSTYGALLSHGIAMGANARAESYHSIAIGENTRCRSERSAAIGNYATLGTSAGGSIALMGVVNNFADNAVALGKGSVAGSGGDTTALGRNSMAQGGFSVALAESRTGGNRAFAAAITNNTSSYGANGDNSIAIGQLAKSAAGNSVAIGQYNTTNATFSAAIGGAGNVTQNTASYSFVSGNYAKSTIVGQKVHASGQFAAAGDAQGSTFILRADTTDATATVLTTNNGTGSTNNQIVAASDTCIMFSGTLVAMQNSAQDQGGWEIKGLLKNDGGTTTLVSSNIQTFAEGNGWTVALSADNTNNALAITCTGEASHNIRWVANIQTSEVTYA